jgi:hypothetical protein
LLVVYCKLAVFKHHAVTWQANHPLHIKYTGVFGRYKNQHVTPLEVHIGILIKNSCDVSECPGNFIYQQVVPVMVVGVHAVAADVVGLENESIYNYHDGTGDQERLNDLPDYMKRPLARLFCFFNHFLLGRSKFIEFDYVFF